MTMKLDEYLKNNSDSLLLLIGFVFVLIAGFFSGYFYSREQNREDLSLKETSIDCSNLVNMHSTYLNDVLSSREAENSAKENPGQVADTSKKGLFVASKNSNIYHKPDCVSAKNIKEENKIWFNSEIEAQNKGYRPSKSCFK